MALMGKVFAERKPLLARERGNAAKQKDAQEVSVGDFTEFGTLPREAITRLGLRHVYTMPVVLEDNSTAQFPIYRAEVLWRIQWRRVYVQ